jgi:hypothetical protein
MWLHLGGAYWQRSSFDAIVVIASILALIAAAPRLRTFGLREWLTTLAITISSITFAVLWLRHMHAVQWLSEVLKKVEAGQPK